MPVPSPQRPRRRPKAGSSLLPAALGEHVEERVGGGVVALTGGAEDTGDRGEEDEVGEIEPAGQLVQLPGCVDLGREDAIDLLRAEAGDDSVVDHTGRVDHGSERMLGGDRVEQALQLRAIGYVAGGQARPRPPFCRALTLQLRRTGGVGTAAAVAGGGHRPCAPHQVTGKLGAKVAGGTGDQRRLLGIEFPWDAPLGHGARPRHPRHQSLSPRRATWGSAPESAVANAARLAGSRSTSTATKRPGYSELAERISPRAGARARSGASPSPAATALSLTRASRVAVERLGGEEIRQQREQDQRRSCQTRPRPGPPLRPRRRGRPERRRVRGHPRRQCLQMGECSQLHRGCPPEWSTSRGSRSSNSPAASGAHSIPYSDREPPADRRSADSTGREINAFDRQHRHPPSLSAVSERRSPSKPSESRTQRAGTWRGDRDPLPGKGHGGSRCSAVSVRERSSAPCRAASKSAGWIAKPRAASCWACGREASA